jgi:hypothetical protein
MNKNIQPTNCDSNELKPSKYKSIFFTSLQNEFSRSESKSSSDLANLDKFLENEKITNSNEPWSKLDKTAKIRKLTLFADNYKIANELTDLEYDRLISFFKECLDKKKLQRVKDVNYNKDTGEIKNIPALFFNKPLTHFTLKNIDKRVSTLKGLAPKKKQGTAKNIKNMDDSDSDKDDVSKDD